MFVPADFEVPLSLTHERFVLQPLRVSHNLADLRAWTSSIEHIQNTPGFADWGWPTRVFTVEENAKDLAEHEDDFARWVGFTYTVLDPDQADVIGCVYIYPSKTEGHDVSVRSWVRADHADLDGQLYQAVSRWLVAAWPFASPDYAVRSNL
jgi:hypothetical protein